MCHIMSLTLVEPGELIHSSAGRFDLSGSRNHRRWWFLIGQRPGTNPARQRGFPVPTDKPTLIVSSRALSSADKREWKEITTLHSTVFRPIVHLTLSLRVHRQAFYALNLSPQTEKPQQKAGINSHFLFSVFLPISPHISTCEFTVRLNYLLMRRQCLGLAHGFVHKP